MATISERIRLPLVQWMGGRSPANLVPYFLVPLAFAVIHLACLSEYGFFRDELYFLVCAERLAWGYVDHPPLSVALLAGATALFGESLETVRLLSMSCGMGCIVLCALIVRRLGGGLLSQTIGALAAASAPVYMVVSHLYSMNSLDLVLWPAGILLFLAILHEKKLWHFLAIGAVFGLALLNKPSASWLMMALGAGLLATKHRRLFIDWRFWAAMVIAFAIFSPNLIWQAQHGWPTAEFARNASEQKMNYMPPWTFLGVQIVVMGVFLAPFWAIGVWRSLAEKQRSDYRALGIGFILLLVTLMIYGRTRVNYLAPAYMLILGPAAIWVEQKIREEKRGWLAPTIPSVMFVLWALGSFIYMPLLPPATLAKVISATQVVPPKDEKGEKSVIQGLADMFGWHEVTETAEMVWKGLPAEEQADVVIFAHNYGEASALTILGRKRGLPPVASGHNSYWHWGDQSWSGETGLWVGEIPDEVKECFGSVELGSIVDAPYAVPDVRNAPVWIVRDLQVEPDQFWKIIKRFV